MRSRGWIFSTLLLALAPMAVRAGHTDRNQWKLAEFTWVKLVAAEPGAPANTHPARLSPEALQSALSPVQVKDDGKDVPLFGRDELKDLTRALSEALALAQPGEDLILLSTSRHGAGYMERATGLTARLFLGDGALNLIVHDARLDFMDKYLRDNLEPNFGYGSRKAASAELLQAPSARRLRGDWLALPLVAAPALTPAAAPAPAPAQPAAPMAAPAPAAPVAPPQAAAPAPAPAARDATFYEAQTLRLKALKRLRDENLLSEAEYQERREAILKTL